MGVGMGSTPIHNAPLTDEERAMGMGDSPQKGSTTPTDDGMSMDSLDSAPQPVEEPQGTPNEGDLLLPATDEEPQATEESATNLSGESTSGAS